jgi:hypothetical protein
MGQAGVEAGDAVRGVTDGRFWTMYLKSQRIFCEMLGNRLCDARISCHNEDGICGECKPFRIRPIEAKVEEYLR